MKRTISAVLCAALALTLAGCAEEKEPMLDRTVTVETTAAQTGELSTESTYIGTISAEGTASVVSLVSGNVEEVMVSVGDTVSAGDPLCRIDDESARLALQNAQAAYQSAQESYNSAQAGYGGSDLPVLEEQLRLAQDNYEDTQHLFEMGAASQAEVDQANQALLSAQAGVEAARAGLSSARAGIQSAQVGVNSAQYQLSLYNMTAPISGVVEAVNLTLNNFAASGTVAFVISNGSNKTVTFYVTDQVRQAVAGCDLLVCETNYDPDWMRTGPYPYALKQRIMGDHGHLSNQDGAELAAMSVQSGASIVILAHLSAENNTPARALETVSRRLRAMGCDPERDIALWVAPRNEMGPVCQLNREEAVLC